MIRRHDAPAHPVHERRHLQRLDHLPSSLLGAVRPHVGSEEDDGTLCFAEKPNRCVDVSFERRVPVPSGSRDRNLRAAEERVHREIEERRTTMSVRRDVERSGGSFGDLRRVEHRLGTLRHRSEDRDVVHLLEAPLAPTSLRRPAAEHQHRRPVEMRRHHRVHAVDHARTCRQCRDPRGSRQLAVRFGRERSGLLVPDVNDAHPARVQAVVDRKDVAAGQRVDAVDAVHADRFRDEIPAVSFDLLGHGHAIVPARPRAPQTRFARPHCAGYVRAA